MIPPGPEIMIPLVGTVSEFTHQKSIVDAIAKKVQKSTHSRVTSQTFYIYYIYYA